MENKRAKGNIGEQIACKYLIKNNYKILEKNFYFKGGEIDIISFDCIANEIVFVEVKTRLNNFYGMPRDSVDKKKIYKITKGIKEYLRKKIFENSPVRADLIEIYYFKSKFYINHIKQII